MKAIDRATAHFAKQTPAEITVPQWTDDAGAPLTIFVNPLTVKDRDKLSRLEERIGSGLELVVMGMIWHCRDDMGEHLFTLADKPDLMNRVDPEVVLSIGSAIFKHLDPEVIKKKSEPTDPSASA
jgi:hypothetical protein